MYKVVHTQSEGGTLRLPSLIDLWLWRKQLVMILPWRHYLKSVILKSTMSSRKCCCLENGILCAPWWCFSHACISYMTRFNWWFNVMAWIKIMIQTTWPNPYSNVLREHPRVTRKLSSTSSETIWQAHSCESVVALMMTSCVCLDGAIIAHVFLFLHHCLHDIHKKTYEKGSNTTSWFKSCDSGDVQTYYARSFTTRRFNLDHDIQTSFARSWLFDQDVVA